MFKTGDKFTATDGSVYTITGKKLGEGSQGIVYPAVSMSGEKVALKWYKKETYLDRIDKDAFLSNLEKNAIMGPPKTEGYESPFVWPQKVMERVNGSSGYIMKLFPKNMNSLTDIVLGKDSDGKPVRWMSWFARITAVINVARAFELLHLRGYSYQDINPGGFRFNTSTGEALICDCDNVAPNGKNLGIRGVIPYMAPEVACGCQMPDTRTDQYSMAILFFRMLFGNHPMEGKRSKEIGKLGLDEDERALRIYGTEPCYCLARNDSRNRPVRGVHNDVLFMWENHVYPMILGEAFEQVFTQGIRNRNLRLTDTEWCNVLLALRDRLVQIEGREQFVETGMKQSEASKKRFEACRMLYCRELDRRVYVMPNKVLYDYHARQYGGNYLTPIAKVVASNRDPNILGMMNGMRQPIYYTLPNGTSGQVEYMQPVALLPGNTIQIGECRYFVK